MSDEMLKKSGGGSFGSQDESLGEDYKLFLDDDEDTYIWGAGADGYIDFFVEAGRRIRITASAITNYLQTVFTLGIRGSTDAVAPCGTSSVGWSQVTLGEVSAPGTPTTAGVLYIADNGGTKELRVKFANGTEKVITTHT